MPAGHLLIVAPDRDLSRSLVFALEAEGFEVMALDELPPPSSTTGRRFDCAVLDQKAVSETRAFEAIAFCIKSHPVVLLAASPLSWLVDWVARTVDTPVAGDALIAAVRAAIQTPEITPDSVPV